MRELVYQSTSLISGRLAKESGTYKNFIPLCISSPGGFTFVVCTTKNNLVICGAIACPLDIPINLLDCCNIFVAVGFKKRTSQLVVVFNSVIRPINKTFATKES